MPDHASPGHPRRSAALSVAFALVLGLAGRANAQVAVDVVHPNVYRTEGGGKSALIQDTDGNFYGTAHSSGGGGLITCCGTVFRMRP